MSRAIVTNTISAIWLASEIVLNFLKRAKTTDKKLDKSSFKTIWVVIAFSVAAGVYIGYHQFGHFGGDSLLFPVIGITMMICGIVLRWVAILTLKRQFTVDIAITQGHRLVNEGIYHYLRHPSYAGSLLSFFGLGFVFPNYVSIIVIFAPIYAVFLYRIKIEEQVLIGNFGTEYLDYCSTTKRLIPYVY